MLRGLLDAPETAHRLRALRARAGKLLVPDPLPAPADRPEAILAQLGQRAIFMLSLGRSGTTVFGDFLATNPAIIKMGEVLNERTMHSFFHSPRWLLGGKRPSAVRYNFFRFLRDKARAHPGAKLLFDMKLETLHLIEGNFRLPGYGYAFLDVLSQSDCPVILVERRDQVARYLSIQVAMQQDRFHSYEKGRSDEGVTIDIDRMARVVAISEAQNAFVLERFRDHPRLLHIAYEDMFLRGTDGQSRFDPAEAARIAAALGVENRFDMTPRLEQLSGAGGADPILNRAEVEAFRARYRAAA